MAERVVWQHQARLDEIKRRVAINSYPACEDERWLLSEFERIRDGLLDENERLRAALRAEREVRRG